MELQRPYARHDRARNRALAALARRLGVRVRGHRRRARAHARQGRAAGRVRGAAPPHHARCLRAAAPRQPQPRDEHAAGDGQPLRRPSRGGARDAAAGRAADVRSDAGISATAIRGPRTRAPRGAWPSCAGSGWQSATARARPRPRARRLGEAGARLEQELRVIERLGLAGFFLLHHDMLELAREVALEVRGPDSVRALLAPGRGRGSSVSSLVCYLTGLSHIDPIASGLALGRFLHEDLRGLPDIDLDFPRDIRERLIPRVHERYGHDRAALVAAFPDLPRARGDPRAGQGARPARRGDRARGARRGRAIGPGPRAGHRRWRRSPAARRGPAQGGGEGGRCALGALALAGAPGRAGLRAAPPPLPALGRDDRRDQAADRLLPGGARRDGGQADGPVGQGLLRGRGLPEDRPAGPGDALGGRALRGGDRARARRAHRPLAHPVRRPADLQGDPRGRHGRRLSDREPRADAVAAAHAPE